MNLNPVYELKNRLEMAAIAGVNLISEDFRLRRAVEAMAPFAAASPVFKKIYLLAQSLISPECKDRPGTLLDALALVDAVCTTQGTLIAGGELLPMKADAPDRTSRPDAADASGMASGPDAAGPAGDTVEIKNVPYSVMAPVVEAFEGTGGGRYAVIRDAHEANPALFDDYRIEYRMVRALGDSYADLADMVAFWLKKKGKGIIPLLKQGFQTDGGRDMARRIQVMEEAAGKEENEFYRSMVGETASKEVKEAAVRALRHDAGNVPLLLDLLKAEKGKTKSAALYALSFLDGEEVSEYWSKAIKKKPMETVSYLGNSSTDWAADLIADSVNGWLEEYQQGQPAGQQNGQQGQATGGQGQATGRQKSQPAGQKPKEIWNAEMIQRLSTIWDAAEGKHSPRLCQCYETVFTYIPQHATEVLTRSLIRESHPALTELAERMFEKHGDDVLEPYAVMAFLTRPKETVYEMFEPYLKTAGILNRLTGKNMETEGLIKALGRIYYIEETGQYRMALYNSGALKETWRDGRTLRQGLDERWYPLLLESGQRFVSKWKNQYSPYGNRYDAVVAQLYRPDREELKKPYGAYFYEKAKRQSLTQEGIRMMKRCGWTDYRGLLATEFGRRNSFYAYQIRLLISELPLSSTEVAEELDEILKKVGKKAINGISLVEKWRDELKNGGSLDSL